MLHRAAEAVAERDPDLFLCQEVFHGIEEDLRQCHYLTAVIGHDHAFGPNAFYSKGCHGNATFARMPIVRHKNVDVTRSALEKRGILMVRMESEQGPFEVLNLHFSLTGRQRRWQWRQLMDQLPENPDTPVLVAGDFNDWNGQLDRRARSAGLLRNALWTLPGTERRTFPARRPLFSLDRIYFRGLRLVSVEVLDGEPWRELSDHLPVEAVFEPI